MCYNLIKILCQTTLVLTIMLFGVKTGWAQGTVSLADDIEDELSIDSNVPDEISLFADDDEFSSGLIQPASKVETTTTTVTETVTTNDDYATSTINLSDDEDFDDVLEEYDSIGSSNIQSPLSVPSAPVVIDDNFGEDILTQIDDKLFSQMSEIEKQTALLTLELRREKIKNEIEAIRIQRQKALEAEELVKEQKAREKAEWENEQQRKLIAEQTKLQEETIKLEKLRQEKVINAYKNEMLKTNQKWIESLNTAYNETRAIEAERDDNLKDFKTKMASLSTLAQNIGTDAITAKENYDREIQNLQTQISIQNTRIETMSREKIEQEASTTGASVDNPFASTAFGTSPNPEIKLSDEYVVLEIRGKGEDITARIANKTGTDAFFVRKGTRLRSGHRIEEVTQTYIKADKSGEKDFLYFSAGGVLDREPEGDNTLRPVGGEEGDTGPSIFGRRSDNAANNNPKVNVSDNFIEQMFAE